LHPNKLVNELIAQEYPALVEQWTAEYAMPCAKPCGKFKNIDPIFGLDRTELIHITPKVLPGPHASAIDSTGHTHAGGWVATKLVGDANVPRGKVSWITGDFPVSRILRGRPVLAAMQVRTNVHNPNAFSWMQGAQVNYNQEEDLWRVGIGFGANAFFGRFVRVSEEEAAVMVLERDQQDCV